MVLQNKHFAQAARHTKYIKNKIVEKHLQCVRVPLVLISHRSDSINLILRCFDSNYRQLFVWMNKRSPYSTLLKGASHLRRLDKSFNMTMTYRYRLMTLTMTYIKIFNFFACRNKDSHETYLNEVAT